MIIKRLSVLALASSLMLCANAQSTDASVHPYALPPLPARVVTSAPSWFVTLPESTADMVFAAGTASSTDEQMAYDKARMQAERKLVEQMSAQIRSQTKSHRIDTGETMSERTEITVQKSANGELVGAQRVDSQAVFDGRVYKVYVLLRLPLADHNYMKRERDQARARRDTELRAARAHQDLELSTEAERVRQETTEQRTRNEIGPRPVPQSAVAPITVAPSTTAPALETVPTANGEVKLMQVDNEEYKRRRDEALAKPGAVIGQSTYR